MNTDFLTLQGNKLKSAPLVQYRSEHADNRNEKEKLVPFPKTVGVFLTSKCNYKCFFCQDRKFVDLPLEDFYKFKSLIQNAEIFNITGTGEPLFYKHIKEAIQFINENNKKNCISLNTNGSLLTEELAVLLSKNLHFMSISLNAATKETYEHDMKNGNWENVLSNIRNARKYIPREKMALVFVAHGDNIHEFPDFVRLAHELDIGQVEMKNLLVHEIEYLRRSLWFCKEKTNVMVDKARELAKKFNIKIIARNFNDDQERQINRFVCSAPYDQAYITLGGQVSPCCYGGHTMGNVFTEGSFEKIWNNEKYKKLRKERFFPECKTCGCSNPWNRFESHLTSGFYKGSNKEDVSIKNLLKILYEWKDLENVVEDQFARLLHKIGEEALDYGNNVERAIGMFSEAIKVNPYFASAYNNIGIAYCMRDDFCEAWNYFRKAAGLEPGNRLYVINYGKVLESFKMMDYAKQVYSTFLKIHPDDNEIKSKLESINIVTDLDNRYQNVFPRLNAGQTGKHVSSCPGMEYGKVFVTGASGTGKTTFARRYASNHNVEYVSFDSLYHYHYPNHPEREVKTNQAIEILSDLPSEFVIDAIPEFRYSEGSHIWSDFIEYYEENEGEIQIVCTICSSLSRWLEKIYLRKKETNFFDLLGHLAQWQTFYNRRLKILLDKNLIFYDSYEDKLLTKEQGIELISSMTHNIKTDLESLYMMNFISTPEKERIVRDIFKHYLNTLTYDKTYQDIEIIDYKGYSETYKTWENIKDLVSWKGKSVLDLGCFHGFIAFKAEEAGANVQGFELLTEVLATAEIINDVSGHNIKLRQWRGGQETPECDIILCLNVLHHFDVPEVALHRMHCKEAIFEVGEEFLELIQRHFRILKTIPSHRESRIIVLCERLKSKGINQQALDIFIEGVQAVTEQGNLALAAEKFLKVIELKPDFAYAYNSLGFVYGKQGNYDLALEHFRKAVSLEPRDYVFVINYGKLLEFLGLPGQAKEVYSNFLNLKVVHGSSEINGALQNLINADVANSKPQISQDGYESVRQNKTTSSRFPTGSEPVKVKLVGPATATLILCEDEQDADFLELLRDKLNDPYPDTQIICLHSSCDARFLQALNEFKGIDSNLTTIQIHRDWNDEQLCRVLENAVSGRQVFWIRGNGAIRNRILQHYYSIYTKINGIKIPCIRQDERVDDYLDKKNIEVSPVPFPKFVGIYLTSCCNYRCFFCEDRKPFHLPLEDLYRLKTLIRNAEVLNITGSGEPLFYKHIKEAIHFINENNDKNCISLNTNGSLLTEEMALLLSKNLHFISISLNAATKQTYERDIKNANWENVLNNIRNARKYIPREKMSLVFVAHGDNIHEFPDFVRLANELDVGQVEMKNFIVLDPGYLEKSLWFHKDKTNSMVELARSLGTQLNVKVLARSFKDDHENVISRFDCSAPFDSVLIAANGDVGACCFAKQPMGNIYAAGSFEKVWNGKKYRRLRKEKYFPECKTCGNANPWNKFESHLNTSLYKSSGDGNDSVKNLLEILYKWKELQNIDDDQFVRVLHKLGEEALDYSRDVDRAIELFSEAIRIKPVFASAYNNIGFAYCRKAEPQMALEHFRNAVKLEPGNRLFVMNCGEALVNAGRSNEAAGVYTDYLRLRPDDREVSRLLKNLNQLIR